MEFVASWQPLAVAAATLSLLIVGAVFCAGAILNLHWLRAWAKNELFQVIVSCLLIGSLLVITQGLSAFSFEFTHGQDPIVFAQGYLRSLNGNLSVVSEQVLLFSMVVTTLRDMTITVEPSGIGVSTRPLAGLAPVVKEAEFILSALSFVRLTNAIQDVFFVFIASTMMYYFMPVGVILRTFPFTRRVGAFMMALAVGLYFVLPLTYVFNAAALERTNALINANAESLRVFTERYQFSRFNFLDPVDLSRFVIELVAGSIWDAALQAIKSLAILIANLTVQTTFFPLFNLGVVFLFTLSLYRALSSESRWMLWN